MAVEVFFDDSSLNALNYGGEWFFLSEPDFYFSMLGHQFQQPISSSTVYVHRVRTDSSWWDEGKSHRIASTEYSYHRCSVLVAEYRPIDQTSGAGLELVIFHGVNKWIDTAVQEHRNDAEVIKDAGKIDLDSEIVKKEKNLVPRRTQNETTENDE
jgi:hypothetical protein